MKNTALARHITRRISRVARAAAVAIALTVSSRQGALAADVAAPPVPVNIQVPPGNTVFLVGHGVGTQNYICLRSGAGVAWTLFTPQATLFNHRARQLTTHFFSPNPSENGTVRATWQHSRDTSIVWAQLAPNGSSSDPSFVAPDSIPWLLLQKAGTQEGYGGGDTLTVTTYIQRLNTREGRAPSTGCALSTDVGRKAFVPYEADYFFYTDADRHGKREDN